MTPDPDTPSGPAPSDRPAESPASSGRGAAEPQPAEISLEEFSRLDLRVARVTSAQRHPKADRLLKLQIDLGSESRQIVAGIASCYAPEDLVGRLIVVVANLKPARLRGELSQGMLLAAASGEVISVLRPDQEIPPGSQVH